MRLPIIVRLRLRSLFWRHVVEDELDEELRYHLDRQVEENLAAGMSPREARDAALREFDGLDQRKEECRDMRGWNFFENMLQDLRFSLRQLAKNPGFTATAILMLSLGICASVAIFAFVDATLLQPLPYRDAKGLVSVFEHTPACKKCNLSYFDFLDWKKMNKVFRSLDAYHRTGFILTTRSGAEAANAARVSAGFFRTLGVAPILGRDFAPGEDQAGAIKTVLLSHRAWEQRFSRDPKIVGTSITLDDASYLIIGVLPRDFHFAPAEPAEFWAPLNPQGGCETRRSCHNLYGVARLADGPPWTPPSPTPPSSPNNSSSSTLTPIAARARTFCL